ncbi:MAG TPA: MBL fold metallo-hydrolase [Myxococcota bacterium]
MMSLKFYGVRGSIATAGDDTRRYGGNTSCVAVRAAGQTLIFDAGTGIRPLGNELFKAGGAVDAHLFFSHLHWDHIQGFPFFGPAFAPTTTLNVYGVAPPTPKPPLGDNPFDIPQGGESQTLHDGAPTVDASAGVRAAMAAQMTAPNFPVGLDAMRADMRFCDVPYGERIHVGPVLVRHVGVDHPNGCVAYRVEHGGKSVVYATDLELAEGKDGAVFDALVDLSRNADLLVFDAMYTPEEYDGGNGRGSRRGWGHSTFEMGAAVADAAHVGQLCLFHHDPAHDDAFMDALHERAQKRFAHVTVAREGLEVSL